MVRAFQNGKEHLSRPKTKGVRGVPRKNLQNFPFFWITLYTAQILFFFQFDQKYVQPMVGAFQNGK